MIAADTYRVKFKIKFLDSAIKGKWPLKGNKFRR